MVLIHFYYWLPKDFFIYSYLIIFLINIKKNIKNKKLDGTIYFQD